MTANYEGTGETILVVEDNLSTRTAIEAILDALGYQVLLATNGREALSIYRAQPKAIALVMSDLIMPEMGGPDLYVALNSEFPDAKMMIMTGYPIDDEGEMFAQKGIRHWIQKPFTLRELSGVIREALEAV